MRAFLCLWLWLSTYKGPFTVFPMVFTKVSQRRKDSQHWGCRIRVLPLSMYALRRGEGVRAFWKICVHMYICPVHGGHFLHKGEVVWKLGFGAYILKGCSLMWQLSFSKICHTSSVPLSCPQCCSGPCVHPFDLLIFHLKNALDDLVH